MCADQRNTPAVPKGQTHRKVGAQSFRSKGYGLRQRGCRDRGAISLTRRDVVSSSLQQLPDQPSLRRTRRVARAFERWPLAARKGIRRSWGLKCKLASRRGVVHSSLCSPLSSLHLSSPAAFPTDRRRVLQAVRAPGTRLQLAVTIPRTLHHT